MLFLEKQMPVPNVLFCFAGSGSAGHQCFVPEIPSEAQRHDDLPLQYAQGRCRFETFHAVFGREL